MIEEPKLVVDPEASAAEAASDVQDVAQNDEDDAGDFIARQVLEKDSVFFEG